MRTFLSYAAAAVLLAATGCSEQEIVTPEDPGNGNTDNGVALGITTGVLSTQTKAVVEGEAISYVKANYPTQPGMGIVVLNSEGTGLYSDSENKLANDHVWFMGDEKGANWKSISALGADFSKATPVPYYLTEAVGTVYAYYPKMETDSVSGFTKEDLSLKAHIKTEGTITLADGVTNADVKWNTATSSWVPNTPTSNKKLILAAPDETDYLYADGLSGRYVNNGRVGATENGNTDATNPGRFIPLNMAHALSMVTFRVYNDGTLEGDGVLSKIIIRNAGQNTVFKSGGEEALMNLATGAISGLTLSDSVKRIVANYIIPRKIKSDETESATQFKETASTTGPKVARKISLLIYPLESFAENEIELAFTIDGKEFTVPLPISDVAGWAAGYNYLYTVRASQRSLEISEVTVTEWADETGGDIDI